MLFTPRRLRVFCSRLSCTPQQVRANGAGRFVWQHFTDHSTHIGARRLVHRLLFPSHGALPACSHLQKEARSTTRSALSPWLPARMPCSSSPGTVPAQAPVATRDKTARSLVALEAGERWRAGTKTKAGAECAVSGVPGRGDGKRAHTLAMSLASFSGSTGMVRARRSPLPSARTFFFQVVQLTSDAEDVACTGPGGER